MAFAGDDLLHSLLSEREFNTLNRLLSDLHERLDSHEGADDAT